MIVLFEKSIEKLFPNGKISLLDQQSEYTEEIIMKHRDEIWNEIRKLAESLECRGGKWINIVNNKADPYSTGFSDDRGSRNG